MLNQDSKYMKFKKKESSKSEDVNLTKIRGQNL